MEGVEASLIVPFLPELLWYDVEVCNSSCEGRMDVEIPVGCSVSNHESLEWDIHQI